MPSSVFNKIVPFSFKALDSDIAADGAPVSSLMLRGLAGNSNRILGAPQVLFNFLWDSGWTDTELEHGLRRPTAYAGFTDPLTWVRVLGPIRVPKKSVAQTMHVQFYAHFDLDVHIQWVTSASPFLASKTATAEKADLNVQFCPATPDGHTWQLYGQSGLVIGPGNFETISAYIRGDASDTLIDESLYGAPNHGTADFVHRDEFGLGSATWNLSDGSSDFYASDNSVAVVFVDDAGTPLTNAHHIDAVFAPSQLQFSPPLTDAEISSAQASRRFELRRYASWRFANITAYTEQV